ncbi:MAG: crosslink repair DNA glycosylase YcaQ family protein, partial [Hyphomicrobiaceae bacterium]
MSAHSFKPQSLSLTQARRIWLNAQRLDVADPFGQGPDATRQAIEHLGYVQIDTINVIERCHHHILYSRIPTYQRDHLRQVQSVDKSAFEYWTHALSYVPTRDLRYFLRDMQAQRLKPDRWFGTVNKQDLRKVLSLIRNGGPLTIRDIDDDVLVVKDHPWASRKPSKRALQFAFYTGDVTVNERAGMLKSYELMGRHFGWQVRPKPASERQTLEYLLDRALRTQGVINVESVCYLDAKRKQSIRGLIEARVRRRELLPVSLEGVETAGFWMAPETLEMVHRPSAPLVHILSPFDPLIIQRRRLRQIFGYEHRFEAYVPKEKRTLGYFALPVLIGDEIVAAIDLKTDRAQRKLLVQKWTWTDRGSQR